MNSEVRRQAWYALALVLTPLTIWQLDQHVGWFADLPRLLHLGGGFVVILAIFALLRLTNPWETSGRSPQQTGTAGRR